MPRTTEATYLRDWNRTMRRVRLWGRLAPHGPFAWERKPRVFDRIRYVLPGVTYEAEIRCGMARDGRALSSIYGEKRLPRGWRRKR